MLNTKGGLRKEKQPNDFLMIQSFSISSCWLLQGTQAGYFEFVQLSAKQQNLGTCHCCKEVGPHL